METCNSLFDQIIDALVAHRIDWHTAISLYAYTLWEESGEKAAADTNWYAAEHIFKAYISFHHLYIATTQEESSSH